MYQFNAGQMIDDRYQLLEKLSSQSNHCSLFRALSFQEGQKRQVFLKIFQKSKFFEKCSLSQTESDEFMQKVKASYKNLARYPSPVIAKCYQCILKGDAFFVELEYLNGGNLLQVTKKHKGFSTNDAILILQQIVLCLQEFYLKHRKTHCHLKMSDFVYHNGLLKLVNPGNTFVLRQRNLLNTQFNFITQPQIFAPEVIENCYTGNQKSDMWSLGAIFLILINWKEYNGIFTHQDILRCASQTHEQNAKRIIQLAIKERVSLKTFQKQIMKMANYKEKMPSKFLIFPHSLINTEEEQNLQNMERTSQFQSFISEPQNEVFLSFCYSRGSLNQIQGINDEDNLYQKSVVYYQQLQRSKYIYHEVIEASKCSKWAKINSQTQLFKQIMYLLHARLFFDFCTIRKGMEQIQCQNIQFTFKKYFSYSQIATIFKEVSAELTGYQNSYRFIFFKNPYLKIFKRKYNKEREKFLSGFQGIDFTRQEQIQFTEKQIQKLCQLYESNANYLKPRLYQRLKMYQVIVNYQCLDIYSYFQEKIVQEAL